MPNLIAESSPPRPPDIFLQQATGIQEVHRQATHKIAHWDHQLVVWLQQQNSQLRNAVNWLIQQINIRNLVPDSDIKDPGTFWTVGAGIAVTDAVGAGGGRAFTINGGPVTADAASDPITVQANGDFYVLSGWIDARDLVSGTLSWLVKDAFGPTIFAQIDQVIGQFSRVEVVCTVPAGFSVRVVLRADAVVTGADGVVCSQPQLEKPQTAHGGITTPSATLYRTNIGDH